MPVTEALRTGISIADRLRQLHEQGSVHGALTPSTVSIHGDVVQLLAPDTDHSLTPYTAPEVVKGSPADTRSDIFSFGAILHEMLTGRPAFEASSRKALARAIATATPPPTGSPVIDLLLSECLAKSPDARFQGVQKLMLELRLLSSPAPRQRRSASRRGRVRGSAAIALPSPEPVSGSPMREFEARIASRFEEQERSVASVAQVAGELLKILREQQATPPAQPHRPALGYSSGILDGHGTARLENAFNMLADRVSRLDLLVSAVVERVQKLEANLDAFDTDAAALRDSVTRDIRNFERVLKAQNSATESARTAMAQTDDLLERVVEALDSIQSMFVSPAGQRSLAS